MPRQTRQAIPEKIDMAREAIVKELPLIKYLMDKNLIYGEVHGEGRMKCPVHNDNNPSCHYNTDKNVYHCFACGSKGSVVELDYGIHKNNDEKETIVKTVLRLSKEYNIKIPNMFEYIDDNRPRRENVSKYSKELVLGGNDDSVYARKLERLEKSVLKSPTKIRMLVYNNCDRVLLGEVDAKTMYEKLNDVLKNA